MSPAVSKCDRLSKPCDSISFINIVIYFESRISEIAFPVQPIWKFLGNRLVEEHVHCNVKVTETGRVEIGISSPVLPYLRK
jgi:hypothetical protein